MSELTDIRDTHYRGITTHDLDVAESVFADDVVTMTPTGVLHGKAEFRAFGDAFDAAAPDATIRADRTFEAGDTIITEGTYEGTHTGDLVGPEMTVPASGNRFAFSFVDFMRVADGACVDHRIYWDNLGFMAQIGALPG